MDNKLGMQMFDGGYVHHGLLKAAQFILERETKTLQELLQQNGPDYKLIFAGHSLGSGIAALMTVLVVNNRKMFGNIPRSQIRCYALAPARCMSLNLAVKYADVINSVVLQVRPRASERAASSVVKCWPLNSLSWKIFSQWSGWR
jgi:predicted lipase